MIFALRRELMALVALFGLALTASEARQVDLVIYGGTSAGVMAGVQAAHMGKSVVVVEPGRHLGGLTADGLGWTDIGNKAAIGGLSREFYRRLGKYYGKSEAWNFAPGVAEREFNTLLAEAKVPVKFGQLLGGVRKEEARIVAITTQSGGEFRGTDVYRRHL